MTICDQLEDEYHFKLILWFKTDFACLKVNKYMKVNI